MPPQSFDLESYVSNYSGHTKVKRLLFIASRQGNTDLGRKAAKMALAELKRGINTMLYKEACETFTKQFGSNEFQCDAQWVSHVEQDCQKRLEKLEVELNSYKTNMIRESTRMSLNEIGDFHFARGDLQNALKSYLRMREYCSTPKHIVTMCLNIIKVSLEMGNYALVGQYVSKAEQNMEDDPATRTKVRVAMALYHLDSKKYRSAAKILVEETDIAVGNQFNDVISCQDIAMYGGLCALATFDRATLRAKCLQNASFAHFLELVPVVRDLIHDFHESKYSTSLQYLDRLLPELLNDEHLFQHVEGLYASIRSKALTQYVTPFTSVDIRRMARVFNTTVENLEEELASLIQNKEIKARIDSHNKILYARMTDQRNNTFQNVVELGDNFVRETENDILRLNMLKLKDFAVKPPVKRAGPGGVQGGSGSGHRQQQPMLM